MSLGKGMFSTHSSVTQLKPDTISQCVQEAEEHHWSQGDIGGLGQGSHDLDRDSQDLGSILLSQTTSLRKIHNYFSQLESRKCCLHLACRRSTFNSMRVVPASRSMDDGSAKTSQKTSEVTYLENKDLRVFKHAYLCAVYPVLAAPNPPSPLSPSPVMDAEGATSTAQQRRASYASTSGKGLPSTSAAPTIYPSSSSCPIPTRPITPYSLHDSGVEESDEAGLIPMESVCEQLQRAFRLSRSVFHQYEGLIAKTYAKKSCQRLLAEELSGQLAVLENNSHPFYSPKHFTTQNGYDLWQKQERTHISELLNKFWHFSLPFPRDNQDLISELHSVHEDYEILLRKLLQYESKFRQESGEVSRGMTFTPLSSASCRLLLEFGLRYGIGELYRKTLLLQCLISEFSPSVGYLNFILGLVSSIDQMLPANKSVVIMVKQEYDILHSSLRVLKVQTCKALSQMKTLFPNNRPSEGIELLLVLLQSVIGLMNYLASPNTPREKFQACLMTTVQSIFKPAYEMFKSVALDDLNQGREVGLDPRLLNVLIQDVREDVADYKNNFESTFEKYFSISRMAAASFYFFLMEDVEELSQSGVQHKPLVEIDLRMLALSYRLNTLDSDWSAYITPQQQTWRASFLPSLTQWTTALRSHLQNLVLETIAGDAYVSQNLDLPQPVLTYQSSSTPSDRRSVSFSVMSISPSVNSAFSSIVSSISSTPREESIPEGREDLPSELEDTHTGILDFGLTEYRMRSPERKPKSEFDTRSEDLNPKGDKVHNFPSAFRSYSLPGKVNESTVKAQFTTNQLAKEGGTQSKDALQHKAKISALRDLMHSRKGTEKSQSKIQEQKSSSEMLDSSEDLDEHLPVFTPVPLDENAYVKSLSESREGLESDDEEFRFPPLKIVSQKPVSHDTPSDFTKPVFSKQKSSESIPTRSSRSSRSSRDSGPRHLLRAEAPHSASSRASSITPHLEIDNRGHDFMDSMESNVSFPQPEDNTNQAVMPVSGSAVDILVMLQRLCGFSTNLLTMLLGDNPFLTIPGPAAQRQQSSDSTCSETKASTRKMSAASVSSPNTDGKGNFPIYDRTLSSSPAKSQHSQSKRYRQSSDGGAEFVQTTGSASRQSGQLLSPASTSLPKLQHSQSARRRQSSGSDAAFAKTGGPISDGEGQSQSTVTFIKPGTEGGASRIPHFDGYKVKLKLHLRLLKAMCNMFVVYSTNMLCMDLCATPRDMAKRLIGPQLVEFIESQQVGGLVWGCRHQAEAPHDCLYYYKRKTQYLCDRYEPVSRYMCTRINNVFACLHFLEKYEKNLLKAFNWEDKRDQPSPQPSSDGDSGEGGSEESEDESSASEEFVRVTHDTMHNTSLGEDSISGTLADRSVHMRRKWSYQTTQAVDMTRRHIMSALTGMCRLLAYKLNLFIRDGLYLLLHLKPSNVSVPACLEPITSFLHKYLDSLSTWLYRECFKRVLDNLWVLMVQDFEFHVDKLKKSGSSASTEAHYWMLAISHLIKFMNNSGRGIKKDLLLAQANDVIFRLQLYTLSTWHLIALYQSLRDYYTEGDHLTLEENASRNPPAIIHRIHKELQSLSKCFSGAELVHWIMKRKDTLPADLSLPSEKLTTEAAISICQILLDQQFIVEVDAEVYSRSTTPVSVTYMDGLSPYPQLSIHSHGPSDASRSFRYGNRLRRGSSSNSSGSTVGDSSVIQVEVHQGQANGHQTSPSVTPTPCSTPSTPIPHFSGGDGGMINTEGDHSSQQSSPSITPTPYSNFASPSTPTPSKTPVPADDERDQDNDVHVKHHKQCTAQLSQGNAHAVDSEITPASNVIGQGAGRHFTERLNKPSPAFHQSATVSDFRSSTLQDIYSTQQRQHTDSLSDDGYFFDLENRHTPFSSLAEMTFHGGRKFFPSSKKFYLIYQSVLHPGVGNSVPGGGPTNSSLSDRERRFHKLKTSRESLALVEQCFTHKISPTTILAIIAGRKKTDTMARNFVKQLPSSVSDQISNLLDEPMMECKSS